MQQVHEGKIYSVIIIVTDSHSLERTLNKNSHFVQSSHIYRIFFSSDGKKLTVKKIKTLLSVFELSPSVRSETEHRRRSKHKGQSRARVRCMCWGKKWIWPCLSTVSYTESYSEEHANNKTYCLFVTLNEWNTSFNIDTDEAPNTSPLWDLHALAHNVAEFRFMLIPPSNLLFSKTLKNVQNRLKIWTHLLIQWSFSSTLSIKIVPIAIWVGLSDIIPVLAIFHLKLGMFTLKASCTVNRSVLLTCYVL